MRRTDLFSSYIRAVIAKRELILLLLLALLVLCAMFLPLDQLLLQIQKWAHENTYLATWLVGAAFAVGVLVLVPVSPIALLAGFLFGLAKGLLVIWLAGLIASTLAFWIGRTLARPWVKQKLADKALLACIDREVVRRGFWVVLLTRLAFVLPFGPVSYSLGLSDIRFREYALGTNIGAIPSYLLVVYLGTTASDVAQILAGEVKLGRHEMFLGSAGLALVLIFVVLIARLAARSLRAALAEGETTAGNSE